MWGILYTYTIITAVCFCFGSCLYQVTIILLTWTVNSEYISCYECYDVSSWRVQATIARPVIETAVSSIPHGRLTTKSTVWLFRNLLAYYYKFGTDTGLLWALYRKQINNQITSTNVYICALGFNIYTGFPVRIYQ